VGDHLTRVASACECVSNCTRDSPWPTRRPAPQLSVQAMRRKLPADPLWAPDTSKVPTRSRSACESRHPRSCEELAVVAVLLAWSTPTSIDDDAGASSSGRCNDGWMVAVCSSAPVMDPSGHRVDAVTDGIEVGLAVDGEVRALAT